MSRALALAAVPAATLAPTPAVAAAQLPDTARLFLHVRCDVGFERDFAAAKAELLRANL